MFHTAAIWVAQSPPRNQWCQPPQNLGTPFWPYGDSTPIIWLIMGKNWAHNGINPAGNHGKLNHRLKLGDETQWSTWNRRCFIPKKSKKSAKQEGLLGFNIWVKEWCVVWWPSSKTITEAEWNPGTPSAVGSQGWANQLWGSPHHVTSCDMLASATNYIQQHHHAKSQNATKSLALPAASANFRANSEPRQPRQTLQVQAASVKSSRHDSSPMTDPNGAAIYGLPWIPSIYPLWMLAYIYQHHGSVMARHDSYDSWSPWKPQSRHGQHLSCCEQTRAPKTSAKRSWAMLAVKLLPVSSPRSPGEKKNCLGMLGDENWGKTWSLPDIFEGLTSANIEYYVCIICTYHVYIIMFIHVH